MADAAARGVSRSVAAGRRPAAQRRGAPAGSPRRPGGGGGRAPLPAWFRWARVLTLAAAVVVGLPLAHAMFGEVVALLGGAAVLGFLVGRWTAPGG